MSNDGHCGWRLLTHVLGREVSLQMQGESPLLGPATAAWLTLLAHRLRDRARASGALSVPGGSVVLDAAMDRSGLSLRWEESNGPEGDPGPSAPRLLAPRGMTAMRGRAESCLSLQIWIPFASLEE